MSAAFLDVNSALLHCETTGRGTPVVLLHGFGLDYRMWDEQAARLSKRYLVIRYDQRGYGLSSVPGPESYAHTDDLMALLASLDATPAHVIGFSMGGRNALRFALAHPLAVRSLMLVDSVLDGYTWSPEWQALWQSIDSTAKSGDVAGAKRLWFEHPLLAPAREQPAVAARLKEMIDTYSGWHWLHADPGLAPDTPAILRLDAVAVPTMVVVGERDLPDFQGIADTLASGIRGATKVVMPGAGHMVNMEAPGRFNNLVLEFLST